MDDPALNGSERSMRLESLRVRDFRCFSDATVTLEPDFTVFVGRNDVGKSALLDALDLYGRVGRQGFRAITEDVHIEAAPTKPELTAVWQCLRSGHRFEHTIKCDPKLPKETLRWEDGTCEWNAKSRVLRCNDEEHDARGVRRLDSLATVTRSDWQAETDVPDHLIDTLVLTKLFLTPQPYLFEPSRLALGVPLHIDTVFRNGAGWVILLQDIINRRDGSLDLLESTMHGLFPHFGRVTVVEERYEVTRKVTGVYDEAIRAGEAGLPVQDEFLESYAKSRSERLLRFEVSCPQVRKHIAGCRWVSAETMSSGLLLAMAYLTVALSSHEGSILALEEPENGLNQVITLDMMKRFLAIVKARHHQLLMTTHNGYWLDLAGPDRVRVITRDDNGSHIKADPRNFQRIRDEGLYLSEVMGLGGPEQLLVPRRKRQ